MLVACSVLVLGIGGSVAAAGLWSSGERKREQSAFQTTATNVTQTLQTILRRDVDFVVTIRGVLTMTPALTDTAFNAWYDALSGRDRQVGAIGTAVVRSVPAEQLTSFLKVRNADPMFRALVGGHPRTVPVRSRSCLLATGARLLALDSPTQQLMQQDWCAPTNAIGSGQASLLRAATDTRQLVAFPALALNVQTLFVEAAFYRPGAPIDTVAQRRSAVQGWVVSSFDPASLLSTAVAGNRGLAVSLYHANPGAAAPQLIGGTGRASSDDVFARTSRLSVDGNWSVLVRGANVASGMSANEQGVLVLAAGTVVTILLFLLLLALGRGREHALGLVEEKTGELRHMTLHDPLTGLPNRTLALDRADQMLARARRTRLPVGALYVDIDGFKHVNDTFGHAAGDEFLQTVAGRVQTVIRESDTAARLAGDEFVVLLDGSSIDSAPPMVAERLLEVLREPYELIATGRPLTVTASVGVAYGLEGTAEQLLSDADVALYAAKAAGKNRYIVFKSGMQTATQDRLMLEMDLGDALESDQLFLVYQPTFDLQTERPNGLEALLRWRHPTRGVIPPMEFIPVAEESGKIVAIGRWVLREACRQAAVWHGQGFRLAIAVNVSARQLEEDRLVEDVEDALRDSGLSPGDLTLEITETTLMRDAEATARRLTELKKLGVRIAIDDFGTGYSSLSYLRQFPVDALKIDRSFIKGIADSPQSAALIQTLVRLGKTLELETLAEGIEDRDQLRALQRQKCDHGQGFLFARPLDVEAVTAFLTAGETSAVATAQT